MARAIARDGEGATKLITVKVLDAASTPSPDRGARGRRVEPRQDRVMARPNWGRIVCALGYSGADSRSTSCTSRSGEVVFARGAGLDVT